MKAMGRPTSKLVLTDDERSERPTIYRSGIITESVNNDQLQVTSSQIAKSAPSAAQVPFCVHFGVVQVKTLGSL